ncbi:hypothetical protein [Mycolicibacterium helvum]|uniref:hypothetical protein n=1 Tax=Mycolicibacterium helvum TaxID=1534349 RepID=UPI0013D3AC9E|nr:hypothetical protein [Mycolicibacterium helvum]
MTITTMVTECSFPIEFCYEPPISVAVPVVGFARLDARFCRIGRSFRGAVEIDI